MIDVPVEIVMQARETFESGSGSAEDEDAIEPLETVTEVNVCEAMILRARENAVTHQFLFVRTIDADIRQRFVKKEALLRDRCSL